MIAFVGDVHGRVFHAAAAAATLQQTTLQQRLGRRFDAIVQVGDMGAYPSRERMDAATLRYLELDPSEADFARLLHGEGERAAGLRRLRDALGSPIHFVRGNHEDFEWLRGLAVDPGSGTARVDPFDLLRYVPDGGVLTLGGLRVAFLGGVEWGRPGREGFDPGAYRALIGSPPGSIDVLVTHEGPYGIGFGYRGDVQGSRLLSDLVRKLRPRFHVAGHNGHYGPLGLGPTTYLSVADLVPSARWEPGARGLKPCCLAVLDTEAGRIRAIDDAWLADFPAAFDLDRWLETADLELLSRGAGA